MTKICPKCNRINLEFKKKCISCQFEFDPKYFKLEIFSKYRVANKQSNEVDKRELIRMIGVLKRLVSESDIKPSKLSKYHNYLVDISRDIMTENA